MIRSSKDREAIASLQQAVQDLSAQLLAVTTEVKVLAERHVDTVSQANALNGALSALRKEFRELKGVTEARHAVEAEREPVIDAALQELAADRRGMALMIAANTEQLDAHTSVIATNEALCNDQIKQFRGMLMRLERQSEADLTELRETNAALASLLLRLRPDGASSPAH